MSEVVNAGIVAGGLTEVVINGVTYSGTSYATISAAMSANAVTAAQGGTSTRVDMGTGKTVVADNVTFSGNTTASTGGAILVGNSVLELYNSTLSGNSATNGSGGAIRVNNAAATFVIDGCTFADNTAYSTVYEGGYNDGGAIYITYGSGTISNSVFEGNVARNGGALSFYGTSLFMDNVTFRDNTANNTGVVYLNGGSATIKDSTFGEGQTVYDNGKAVTLTGTITSAANLGGSGFIFEDVSLVFNNASALNWNVGYSTSGNGVEAITFNGSDVVAFRSTDALDITGAVITVGDGITGTLATSVTTTAGQTVYYGTAAGTLGNGLVTADTKGVALISASDTTLTAVASDNITINGTGGTYDTFASYSDLATIYSAYTGQITVNAATTLGGITVTNDFVNNSTITVDDTLTLGDGSILGGAITIDGSAFTAGDTVIANFDAEKITGTISATSGYYTYEEAGDLKIGEAVAAGIVANGATMVEINGTIYSGTAYATISAALNANSIAAVSGGTHGRVATAKQVVVEDALFTGGSGYGGGAFQLSSGAVLYAENVTISGNTGTGHSGAIYNNGGTATIVGSTISNNTTPGTGAMRVNNGGALFVDGCIVADNGSADSTTTGGAFYFEAASSYSTISNTVISGHHARYAGAIGAYSSEGLLLDNVTFSGNTATDSGNAIYAGGGTTTIKDCTFEEGQDIYNNNKTVVFTGTLSIADTLGGGSTAGSYRLDNVSINFNNSAAISWAKSFGIDNNGVEAVNFNGETVQFTSLDLSAADITIAATAGSTVATGVVLGASQSVIYDGVARVVNVGEVGVDTTTVNAVTYVSNTLATAVATTLTIDGVGGSFDTFASYAEALAAYTGYTGNYTVAADITLGGVTVDKEIVNNATITVDDLLTLGEGSILGGVISIDGTAFSSGDVVIANYDSTAITSTISIDAPYYTYVEDGDLKIGEAVSAGIVADGATMVEINGTVYSGTAYATISAALNANSIAAVSGGTHGRVNTAKQVVVEDALFTGGSGYAGGAFQLSSGAVLYVENVMISGNTATGNSGAIYSDGGTVTVVGSTISGNSTPGTGAIRQRNSGVLYVDNCVIADNGVEDSSATGGAIYIEDGSATISNTVISGHSAKNGGGIFNAGTLVLTNVSFSDNSVSGAGAGIYNSGTLTINGATFGDGQTIYNNTGTITLQGVITTEANFGGGANGVYVADGVSFVFNNSSALSLRPITLGDGGVTSATFNGETVAFAGTGVDLSAAAIVLNCTLPTSGALTIATGVTLSDSQAITLNGGSITLNESFVIDDVRYIATVTSGSFTVGLAGAPAIVYIDSDYTGTEPGYGYDKFASLSELQSTYADYAGEISVVGGTYSGTNYGNGNVELGNVTITGKFFGNAQINGAGTYADGSSVVIDADTAAQIKAIFGGYEIAVGDLTATISGDSAVTISGTGEISGAFAFGGHYLASGSATVTGDTTLTVDSGTFSRFVCGGNIAATDTTMILNGGASSTLNITGGVFNEIVAGGSDSQGGTITYRDATITTNISGGTFAKRVYGGNIASKQSYATQDNTSSTLIDIKGTNSQVNLNIDSSSDQIVFNSDIVAGSYTEGKITGSTNVTFSGLGSNLDFSSVLTGDSTSAGETKHLVLGSRNLTFDDFSGDFGASAIVGFDTITFTGDSSVNLTNEVNLASISGWTFELGSTLNWASGVNNFRGDSLDLDFGGATLTSEWTILSGADTVITGWDGSITGGVTIGGETASWDNVNKYYASDSYKLYCDNSGSVYSLKVAAIA